MKSLILVLISFASASAECILKFEGADKPVVLENSLLRVALDPARGGTVTSFFSKSANAELTATWKDEPVPQGFGMFADRITVRTKGRARDYERSAYKAEVVDDKPDEIAVRMTGTSPTGVFRKIQFEKTFRLRSGSAELLVDYLVSNLDQADHIGSIWICNVVRAAGTIAPMRYFYPTPLGTRIERYAKDVRTNNVFVKDAPVGWLAAMGESNRLGLAMSVDYPSLSTLYSFLPGKTFNQDYPTLEWWTRDIMLKSVNPLEGEGWAGKPWTSRSSVMPLLGLERIDGYANGIAAAIDVKDGSGAVSVLSASDRNIDVTIEVGPPLGKSAPVLKETLKLKACEPLTRNIGKVDGKVGAVVKVTAKDGDVVFAAERPFGSKEVTAGYVIKPREKKLPEPRVDATKLLTRSFVTPHVKWATPTRKGKLKTLFLLKFSMQREVVELAQRMDLDYTVIPYHYSHIRSARGNQGMMFYYPGWEPEKEFHTALEKQEWDAVCISSRFFKLVPEATRKLLFERVKEGMAFIHVLPRYVPKDTLAIYSGPKHSEGSAAIRANVPCDKLPEFTVDPTAERFVETLEYGKGRIVLMRYTTVLKLDSRSDVTCLIPANPSGVINDWPAHEYYYSLFARALHWATRSLSPAPFRIDVAGAAGVQVGSKVAIRFSSRPGIADQVRYHLHTKSGETLGKGILPLNDRGAASVHSPALSRSGTAFLDAWLLKDEYVVDWGTKAFTVKSPVTEVKVNLPDEGYPAGATWPVDVQASASARTAVARLKFSATDAHGRLVFENEQPVEIAAGENRWKVSLRIEHPLTIRHSIRATLSTELGEIGKAETALYAQKQHTSPNLHFLVWGSALRNHTGPVARRQLKKLNVTNYQMGAAVAGKRPVSNEYMRLRCDEILRDNFDISLQNVNWMGAWWTKDKPNTRTNCLDDPEYMKSIIDGIHRAFKGLEKMGLSSCSTGDEISIGRYSGFNDFCQSPHSVAAFREWLSDRYADIAALNAEWETDYKSFDEIPGVTWADVEDRANKVPWAEFRTFMETRLEKYLQTFQTECKKLLPGVKTGFDGISTLCSYNGFDWWRISGATDLMTLYRTAAAEHYLPDFYRARGVSAHTSMWQSAPGGKMLPYRAWEMLFEGMNSVDYWYEPTLLNPDHTLSDHGQGLGEAVKELRSGIATLILSAERQLDPIAILYSQPSVHAATIEGFRSRPAAHHLNQAHYAWTHLLHDAGFDPEFISYEQLAKGYLSDTKHKALILPLCYALSDAETANIGKFVEKGGILLADASPGLYNGYCRKLPKGQLDELFGVKRTPTEAHPFPGIEIDLGEIGPVLNFPWSPVDTNIEVMKGYMSAKARSSAVSTITEFGGMLIKSTHEQESTIPTLIRGRRGQGFTCYLNMPVWRYSEIRGTDRGQQLVLLTGLMLNLSLDPNGINHVLPVIVNNENLARELLTTKWKWGDALYAGLLRATSPRSGKQEGALHWPKEGYIYDVRARLLLGKQKDTKLSLTEDRPQLLAWMPYEVKGIAAATGPKETKALSPAKFNFTVRASTGRPTHHVLRCTVIDPSGAEREHYSRNIIAKDGSGTFQLVLAVNDPTGVWKVRAEDVVSGRSVEIRLSSH